MVKFIFFYVHIITAVYQPAVDLDFKRIKITIYYMALVCCRYSGHSDWLGASSELGILQQ